MKKTILLFLLFSSPIVLFAQIDVVIGKYKRIDSKILGGEVTYLEHLPSDYEQSTENYPVLFVMNGHILSTFANAVAILERLSYVRIPKMILIGISNTGNAGKYWACPNESGYATEADNFIGFLENELIPHIDKNYRTENYKLLMGQSNTGLFTMYCMLTNPNLFNAYIVASPMFGWCPDFYLDKTKTFFQTQKAINKKLYVSYGELDYKEYVNDHIDDFEKVFEEQTPEIFKWKIGFIENIGHVPYTTLNDALLFFFSGCTITEEKRKESLQTIKSHFMELSKEYGFTVYPAEEVLFDMAFNRKREKKLDESIGIFKYLINIYPRSARSYYFLGETYREKGDLELAKENYLKTLEINPESQRAINRLREFEKQK